MVVRAQSPAREFTKSPSNRADSWIKVKKSWDLLNCEASVFSYQNEDKFMKMGGWMGGVVVFF